MAIRLGRLSKAARLKRQQPDRSNGNRNDIGGLCLRFTVTRQSRINGGLAWLGNHLIPLTPDWSAQVIQLGSASNSIIESSERADRHWDHHKGAESHPDRYKHALSLSCWYLLPAFDNAADSLNGSIHGGRELAPLARSFAPYVPSLRRSIRW